MLLTTTSTVEGRPAKEYRGIVTGEADIRGKMSDLGAALSSVGSNRDPLHERYLVEAKEAALKKLVARAQELGANAVLAIHLDYEEFFQQTMVSANRTAVVIPS